MIWEVKGYSLIKLDKVPLLEMSELRKFPNEIKLTEFRFRVTLAHTPTYLNDFQLAVFKYDNETRVTSR